jgi:hypothetical protein
METDNYKKVLAILGINPIHIEFLKNNQPLLVQNVKNNLIQSLDYPTRDDVSWVWNIEAITKNPVPSTGHLLVGKGISIPTSCTNVVGTWAYQVVRHLYPDGNIGKYISRVVVWPTCTEEVLRQGLAPILSWDDDEYKKITQQKICRKKITATIFG